MNLSKFKFALKRDGIIGFLNILISKLGLKFRFHTALDKRKLWLVDHLFKISNDKVMSGPFKGMKLLKKSSWDKKIYEFNPDLSSKIVGCYEQEVQSKIVELQKINKKKYFINFGAGEGYFALGVLYSGFFEQSIAFEITDESRNIMIENSKINKLDNRLSIKYAANSSFLKDILDSGKKLDDIFILSDIEGAEFEIFNDDNLSKLINCNLIIEFHRHPIDDENKKFKEKLNKYFKVSLLSTSNRSFSDISLLKELNDDDRWLIASENRPYLMNWFVCTPK